MAKKEVVEYLRQNKNKYGLDALRAELKKAGYTDQEISEAEKELTPQKTQPTTSSNAVSQTASEATQNFAGKPLLWYVDIVKIPTIVVAAYTGVMWLLKLIPIISIIFSFLDIFTSWIVSLGAAIFLAFNAVKKFNATLVQALIAGAIGGICVGIVKAIFDILSLLTSGKIASAIVSFFALVWIPLGEATIWLIVAVVVAALLGTSKRSEQ